MSKDLSSDLSYEHHFLSKGGNPPISGLIYQICTTFKHWDILAPWYLNRPSQN
jgi:hypothetical protein